MSNTADGFGSVASVEDGPQKRRLSSLTLLGLALAGLGVVGSIAGGVGLPLALAGTVLGALALTRKPNDRPWPMTALLTGIVGLIVSVILLLLSVASWR